MRGVKSRMVFASAVLVGMSSLSIAASDFSLDQQLSALLQKEKFTGTLEQDALKKLGRPLDPKLVTLGQNLFFDRILSLSNDNSCAGCHAPQFAFSDSQSITIGVDNNCVVGPSRTGPHNQRRSPSVINAAAYPVMMWNGRFSSISGEAFDNSQGFLFPLPEGDTKGDRACPFTVLYWDFLVRHRVLLQENPRMRMQLRHLDKLPIARRQSIAGKAHAIRQNGGQP